MPDDEPESPDDPVDDERDDDIPIDDAQEGDMPIDDAQEGDIPIDDAQESDEPIVDDQDDSVDDDRGDSRIDDDRDWLSSLLSALQSLEDGTLSGRRRSGRTAIDYDISIGSGEDILDGSRFGGDPFADAGASSRPEDGERGRPRTRRYRPSGLSSDHRLTTREYEDELLVIVDVSGVDPDDVTVGFDGPALVVGVSGRELERVDVPWADRSAEATIKNAVLTVRIERETATDEGDVDE